MRFNIKSFLCILGLIFIIQNSCTHKKHVKVIDDKGDIVTEKDEIEYNFRFIGYDINIDDPDKDRRSYYKIKIDKLEVGRTTIGLESQKKIFESTLPSNRHLLIVEKWALNERKGKYMKLNNIDQPKPDYIYFETYEDKIVIITLKSDPISNRSAFSVEVE